jgi:hypothetical protein
MPSATLGGGAIVASTLKGLNGVATAGADDATPLGLGIVLVDVHHPG